MNLPTRNEATKQLIERAIAYGRTLQSSQTGYLHYCYSAQEGDAHLPIPTLDNFLFALSLLRSRQIEAVAEAKVLLEGLLPFQDKDSSSPSFGNFPIYLHDYPQCKDRMMGLHIAVVLCWILKDYAHGLGSELKGKLAASITTALSQAVKTHQEKRVAYPMAVKLAATVMAADLNLKAFAENEMQHLLQTPDYDAWHSPKDIGVMLSGLLLAYPKLGDSPWKDFWSYLGKTWHRKTCSYGGPSFMELQRGFEPQVTLYDIFMGYWGGVYSARALQANHTHLHAVLIPPTEESLPQTSYPQVLEGDWKGGKWRVFQSEAIVYSLIEGGGQSTERGCSSFKMIWGDSKRVHSMVVQGGDSVLEDFQATDGKIQCTYQLGTTLDVEDKEKSRDLMFFIDMHEGLNFLVEGEAASTFKMGDLLTIEDLYCKISLTFKQQEGEGRYLGHRMLANRCSQILTKGIHRYDVFDWQLFIRTMGRSAHAKLCVVIDVLQK